MASRKGPLLACHWLRTVSLFGERGGGWAVQRGTSFWVLSNYRVSFNAMLWKVWLSPDKAGYLFVYSVVAFLRENPGLLLLVPKSVPANRNRTERREPFED